MPLESLLKLVETLRERIQQHSAALRQSEMLTRYVLVDPLLRELGWDTENPDQVRPEYRVGSGFADYALLSGGKPIIVVEAKKLGTSMADGLMQSIQYCMVDGTPYFAVTDGRHWEVYETHKRTPIDEKRIINFDIVEDNAADVAINAIIMWRPNVESGDPTQPVPPVFKVADEPVMNEPTGESPEPAPNEDGIAPIGRSELSSLPDGELVLCPSHPDGVEFLEAHRAWGFIRISRTPRYFALYVSQPVSEIQYVGEIESIVDPATDGHTPVGTDHESYASGKKLIVFKRRKLWKLAEPVTYGEAGGGKAPQSIRYIKLSTLANAKTLDDIAGGYS